MLGTNRTRESLRPHVSPSAPYIGDCCSRCRPRAGARIGRSIGSSASPRHDRRPSASMIWSPTRPRRQRTKPLLRLGNFRCEHSRSDHPIQILRANSAAFMNSDAPKIPINPTNSHFTRSPTSANTTNSGNETSPNLPIDVKPATSPLSVR